MRRLAILVLAAFTMSSVGLSQAFGGDQPWRDQLEQWRTQHAADLSAPEGWLTVVGLEWLKPGDNSFGTAPDNTIRLRAPGSSHFGIIHVDTNGLELKPPPEGFPSVLQVDGHPAREQSIVVENRSPTKFTAGTLTFFVIKRGDGDALRIKDSQAPARLNFKGLHWYPPDPSYKIEAEWVPFPEPRPTLIHTVIGTTEKGVSTGVAKFTLHGDQIELEAVVQDLGVKNLLFVIRDATSGKTTYAASRFLHTSLPDHGLQNPGKIVLDFNRLENPPCAFTPYATCPLPPDSNRLKVPILAGELRFDH
jgi:uncharacterized protein (DUF1684 family)